MNTHNVNGTASESTETWIKKPEINSLNAALTDEINYLLVIKNSNMRATDRNELLLGTLVNIAELISRTVSNWSYPRPFLPLSSVQAWNTARRIALSQFDKVGYEAWIYASAHLKSELSYGYHAHRYDIA